MSFVSLGTWGLREEGLKSVDVTDESVGSVVLFHEIIEGVQF